MLAAMTTGTAQASVTVGVRLLDLGPLIVNESVSGKEAERGTTTVTGIAGWITIATGTIDARMTEGPHRPATDVTKHGTLLYAAMTPSHLRARWSTVVMTGTSSPAHRRGTWEKNAPSSVPL